MLKNKKTSFVVVTVVVLVVAVVAFGGRASDWLMHSLMALHGSH